MQLDNLCLLIETFTQFIFIYWIFGFKSYILLLDFHLPHLLFLISLFCLALD